MWSPSGVQPHFSHLKSMYPRLRFHGWDSLWNEGKRSKRTAWCTSQGKQYSEKGSSDLKKREHAQASVEWSELKVVGPAAFVTLLCVLNYSGNTFPVLVKFRHMILLTCGQTRVVGEYWERWQNSQLLLELNCCRRFENKSCAFIFGLCFNQVTSEQRGFLLGPT